MKMKPQILGLAIVALFTVNSVRADDDVPYISLPAAVQKTVQDNLRGGKVDDIDRIQIEGRTMYKVEVELRNSNDDDDLKLYIAGDGALIKTREDIVFNNLPNAVQVAARKLGGKVEDVEKVVSQGKVTYHLEIDRDGPGDDDDDLEVVFAEDGSIISQRSDD